MFHRNKRKNPIPAIKSAKTLKIQSNYGIEVGKPGNLLILPAENDVDALRRQVPARFSVSKVKIIAETQPATTSLHFEETETVTFKR